MGEICHHNATFVGDITLRAFPQCKAPLATSLLTSSLFTQDQLTPKRGGGTRDSGCKEAWDWETDKALAELRNPALSGPPEPLTPIHRGQRQAVLAG